MKNKKGQIFKLGRICWPLSLEITSDTVRDRSLQ